MQYHIGQRYNVSDKLKGQLAAYSVKNLQGTKYFYNYGNKLDILARSLEAGRVNEKHAEYADKLVANIRKMNRAQRDKVQGGYETLLTNAQLLAHALRQSREHNAPQLDSYVQRHAAKANKKDIAYLNRKLSQLEDAADKGYLSIHNHLRQLNALHQKAYRLGSRGLAERVTALGLKIADYEGRVRRASSLREVADNALTLGQRVQALGLLRHEGKLDQLVAQDQKALRAIKDDVAARGDKMLAEKFQRIAGHYKTESSLISKIGRYAAAGIVALACLASSCGKKETPKNYVADKPNAVSTDKGLPAQKTPEKNAIDVAKQDKPEDKHDEKLTPDGTGPKPKKDDSNSKAKLEPETTKFTIDDSEKAGIEDTLRFIAKAEVFGAQNFQREALNAEVLLGLGKGWGLSATGQYNHESQQFDNGTLDGDIIRGGLGLYKYFSVSERSQLYLRAAGIFEDRSFKFKPDEGSDFDFGNDAFNIVGQFGYVKGGDFANDTLFDNSYTKLLLTLAYGTGDMKGDITGKYDSLRFTVVGQQHLADLSFGELFAQGGFGYQDEQLGDDWQNTVISGELGVKVQGKHWRAGPAITFRRLESDFDGVKNTSFHTGFKASAGWKPSDWIEFSLDAGYEFDDGADKGFGANAMLGVTFTPGTKKSTGTKK